MAQIVELIVTQYKDTYVPINIYGYKTFMLIALISLKLDNTFFFFLLLFILFYFFIIIITIIIYFLGVDSVLHLSFKIISAHMRPANQ